MRCGTRSRNYAYAAKLHACAAVFTCTDHCVFQPIFLNEVVVRKPADGDATSSSSSSAATAAEQCTFHVHHTDCVYSLKAINQGEREAWMRKTEAASRHYLETERRKREKAHQGERQPASGTVRERRQATVGLQSHAICVCFYV